MTKVATIVATRNGEKWIAKCIACLLKSSIQPAIFVFDNGSTDETINILNSNADNLFFVEKNGTNIGFGAANNKLIKKALDLNFEYFFLVNQDVYVQEHTLECLLTYLTPGSDIGILSPMHVNGNGKALDKNFCSYISKNKSLLNDLFFNRISDLYTLPFVNAACWLLPKKTLAIVGGFDPLFFHYAEDDNYCHRTIFHNLKIVIHTKSFICHDRDQKSLQSIQLFEEEFELRNWKSKLSNPLKKNEKNEKKRLRNELIKELLYCSLHFKFLQANSAVQKFTQRKSLLKIIIEHKEKNKMQGLNWL